MNTLFSKTTKAVQNTYETLNCSGGSLIIYHQNQLAVEQYWGKQSNKEDAKNIQPHTKFHLASCRKTYVGFAVAYAVMNGYIDSIDDDITKHLPIDKQHPLYKGTTIRHLLTHTHGLKLHNDGVERVFKAGEDWGYQGINIDILSEILQFTTKKTIAQIVKEEVFIPLQFKETGWYNQFDDSFVEVIRPESQPHWTAPINIDGSGMNMYASTREFAKWGLLHLNQGMLDGQQVIDPRIIQLATSFQSPVLMNPDLPDNGFLWFVKNSPAQRSEIGEFVPDGSYQILGYTTVTLLVIPQENIVAVRAFNSFGNPEGYNYLRDVKDFGNNIMLDIKQVSGSVV